MKSKAVLLLAALVILIAITDGQAQQVVLTVVDGFGYPNSNGNIVHIDMENMSDEVAAFQFDLHFDTNALSVTDIEKTYRSSSLDLLAFSNIAEGIRVAAYGLGESISTGTGPIAQLIFSVKEEAVPGAYPLVLSDAVFANPLAIELTTATEDGTFLVSEGTTLQVIGTTGSPGSEENEVSLSLHNETALSELSLVLNFDPAILSLTDVLPTDRTEELSHFDWSLPDTGELNLSIHGSEGQIIPSGYGPVAHLYFSVATEVLSGEYPLTLSDIVAKNSTGETVDILPYDGFFTVHGGIDPDPTQETVLSIGEGAGAPNSSGNVVDIHLENKGDEIAAFQFDLHFDINALSVTDMERTSRSSRMDIFNYSDIGDGIRVAATCIGFGNTIKPGTGTIAQLIFEVSAEASPGEYPLVVSDVIFADPLGTEIEANANDGIFFITGGTSLRVIGTWGSAGSENNEVPLSLYNETALSELSFTFSFDPGILLLTDVLPTDRTEELSYFDWNLPDSGQVSLSIRGSAEQVISSGNGPVAILYFSVATEVYTGQYPLTLSNVTAQDSSGEAVDIPSIDGTFIVYGGIEPDIDLSATSFDFSEVEVGDTASWDVTIYNRGLSDLEITNTRFYPSAFKSLGGPFEPVIPAEDSLMVTIGFAPQNTGEKRGSLTIFSNDPDEPEVYVYLRGWGIPERKILISIEDKSGYPGQGDLSSEVRVANPDTIHECSFTINYDTTFISFSDIVRSIWGEDMSTFQWSEYIPGQVMVSLADTTGKLVQPTEEAAFLLFHFDISDSASPGITPLSLSNVLCIGAQGDTLDVNTRDGEIHILEPHPDLLVLETDHHFGYRFVGDTAWWDLVLFNGGEGYLSVDSITTDDTLFSITHPGFPQRLFSGESLSVSVIFTPQTEGPVTGHLSIFSNDADAPQVTVDLQGYGLTEAPVVLTYSQGVGFPGDSGISVFLHMQNSFDIASAEFDLLFDRDILDVQDVQRTQRTSDMHIETFEWSPIVDGVRSGIRLHILDDVRVIPMGAGPIAELVFHVAPDAEPNTYPLQFDFASLYDPSGLELPVEARDGSFTVAAQAALHVVNSSGVPGSTDNIVPLGLMNDLDLGQLQCTVHFPDSILSLNTLAPTNRLPEGTAITSEHQEGMLTLTIESPEDSVILSGDGSILELYFDVGASATPGVYPLSLSDASASDTAGTPLDITLLDGNMTIGFGDIDLSAYEHDFGELSVGDTASWSFTAFNRGWTDLTIFDIISSDSAFATTSLYINEKVPTGSQIIIGVIFVPQTPGTKAGSLRVTSNDPDEDTLFVELNGRAKEPHLQLSVTEIDFGDIEVCASVTCTVILSNDGVGDLIVENLSSDNPVFSLSPLSFPRTLAEGESIEVEVQFSPDEIESYAGHLEILSDDPHNPIVEIPVTGNGVYGEPTIKVGTTYGLDNDFYSDTEWITISLKNDRPISEISCCVNYNADCLTALDVAATPRAAPFSSLTFEITDPGRFSIQLSDDRGGLIGEGGGDMFHVGFETTPTKCDTNLTVSLSDVSILDDSGMDYPVRVENGGFIIEPIGDVLFVGDVSSAGTVPLILSNTCEVAALQADLLLDTTILQVTAMHKTERTSCFDIYNWSNINGGIRVAMTSLGHSMRVGIGPIAQLLFQRVGPLPICGLPITVSGLVVADPLGSEVSAEMGGGMFTGFVGAKLRLMDGRGIPGDTLRSVGITLLTEESSASLEFDVSYDPSMFQITHIIPTSRTELMGVFQWAEIAAGSVHVSIADDEGKQIAAGADSIGVLLFDISTDATLGEHPLILTQPRLLDENNVIIPIQAENGTITVLPRGARLSIGPVSAAPGESDIIVPINLDSEDYQVAAIQFDLNFDTDALQVTSVDKTERTTNLDIFNFSNTSSGVRIAATGIGHAVDRGVGSVADVTFEVSQNAVEGDYWMELSGVVLADPFGGEIEVTSDGNWFTIYQATNVEPTQTFFLPQEFALEQNYPNPFNPCTDIRYQIADGKSSVHTSFKIYNILGQEVRTLVDTYQNPGYYTISWDGRDRQGNIVPCGVYFYRLSVDGDYWTRTKRMVLLK